ncbi:hypothetical protein SAMN02745220_02610 [Desulfopila aestuarii DSM 18488]|uniref:Uncharacterized protein n=1 Tax=Desulfopila aestuarii DSM 18488 TaxID=1121416 RepID=A0A1M7Y905_9BACT|nr:hypothetical protein SAMN02745220_02610 [Desulfopila aestuarii DSM 18488]
MDQISQLIVLFWLLPVLLQILLPLAIFILYLPKLFIGATFSVLSPEPASSR